VKPLELENIFKNFDIFVGFMNYRALQPMGENVRIRHSLKKGK
jgi:hypothetical protein